MPTIRFVEWLRRLLQRVDKQASTPHEHELLAGVLRILGEYAFETHRRSARETREAFLRLVSKPTGANAVRYSLSCRSSGRTSSNL